MGYGEPLLSLLVNIKLHFLRALNGLVPLKESTQGRLKPCVLLLVTGVWVICEGRAGQDVPRSGMAS